MTKAALDRRLARLEAGIPRRPHPQRPRTWLSMLTVGELCLAECLAAPDGSLPLDNPLVQALVAAGTARLAGHDVAPLALEADPYVHGADAAAVVGDQVWRFPDPPP